MSVNCRHRLINLFLLVSVLQVSADRRVWADSFQVQEQPSEGPALSILHAPTCPHPPRGTSGTFIIAAVDSVHRERADFKCDGIDDQVQFQQAIDALPPATLQNAGVGSWHGAGKIVLLEGTYSWFDTGSESPTLPNQLRVEGFGPSTEIVLKQDVTPFVLRNVTGVMIRDLQVVLDLGSAQTQEVFELAAKAPGERTFYNTIEDIRITHSDLATPAYVGISLYASDEETSSGPTGTPAVFRNFIRDVVMDRVGTGIRLQTAGSDAPWINGNTMQSIHIFHYVTGVEFLRSSQSSAGANRNLFIDVKLQTNSYSQDGFLSIGNNGNVFMDCLVWDWDPNQGNAAWSIDETARDTFVQATTLSNDFVNEGMNTAVLEGSKATLGEIEVNGSGLSVSSDDLNAVFVHNTSNNTEGTAVFGITDSVSGTGVVGAAVADSGDTIGVQGHTINGTGVLGSAVAESGATIGVHGLTNSPTGHAGYFTGPEGSMNYFERHVGIGTTTPDHPLVIAGDEPVSAAGGGMLVLHNTTTGDALAFDDQSIQARNDGNQRSLLLNPDGGKVGIGTSSPLTRLHVEADFGFSGIYANNSWTAGSAIGVQGVSNGSGPSAAGVAGVAVNTDPMGTTYGVWGRNLSSTGVGVYGQAESTLGTTYGVRGHVESANGYAAYFTGEEGSKNYFENNVGIGTLQPVAPLHVESNTTAIYAHTDGNAVSAVVGETASTIGHGVKGRAYAISGETKGVWGAVNSVTGFAGYFTGPAGSKNYFQRDVGIGTTDPNVKLHVIGSIQYTGSISDVSDIRLKENIKPVLGALDMVRRLNGVYYNLKDTPEEREVGLIAQDVQAVLPDAVRVVDSKTGYLGVSYPSLIPVLIQAIKEMEYDYECKLAKRDGELQSRDDQIRALTKRLEKIELQVLGKSANTQAPLRAAHSLPAVAGQ